jgi:hypothetical protein
MEWMNRGGEQPAANQPTHTGGTHKKKRLDGLNLRIVSVALLFGLTIIAVGVIWLIAQGGPTQESKYVKGDKLQAVFLNGGQVYFGNINTLNKDYLKMSNIYYLRVNQVVQPDQKNADGTPATQNDISLVKLGCELHGPTDEMVINREQIIFWENLKDDGQVANAVKDYVAKNPNGQDCNAQQSQETQPTNKN